MVNKSQSVVSIREEVNPAPSLDDRIADAFETVMSSADLKALLVELEQANAQAREQSKSAADRALDPKVRPVEVAEARRQMENANFRSNRLDSAAEQLKALLAQAVSSESQQRAAEEYAAAKAERDQLVNDLAAYETHATAIVALIKRISRNNTRLENSNKGRSAQTWLYSAEKIARGAQHEFGLQYEAGLPHLITGVRLPNFRRGDAHGYYWPPAPGTFF